jgi:hypothetical protein
MLGLCKFVHECIGFLGAFMQSETIEVKGVFKLSNCLRLVTWINNKPCIVDQKVAHQLQEDVTDLIHIYLDILVGIKKLHVESLVYLFEHCLVRNLLDVFGGFEKSLLEGFCLLKWQLWYTRLLEHVKWSDHLSMV